MTHTVITKALHLGDIVSERGEPLGLVNYMVHNRTPHYQWDESSERLQRIWWYRLIIGGAENIRVTIGENV